MFGMTAKWWMYPAIIVCFFWRWLFRCGVSLRRIVVCHSSPALAVKGKVLIMTKEQLMEQVGKLLSQYEAANNNRPVRCDIDFMDQPDVEYGWGGLAFQSFPKKKEE